VQERYVLVAYYLKLILIVQGTIAPPPEKPLARIRLCVNGRAAVFTPNIKLTLRVPQVTNRTVSAAGDANRAVPAARGATKAVPTAGDGGRVSVTKGSGEDEHVEINVLVEADNDSSSDGEGGLHRQAAGTLKEYEEDDQRLPGDGVYGTEEHEDELTSNEINIIHEAEQFAQQKDKEASDPEGESEDEPEVDDASRESSDKDDEGDSDFIPPLKLKGKKIPKKFKATGTKKQKGKRDKAYVFCPLSHRLSILRLVCKHFCQHPILRERHGQSRTWQQIHRDAVLEVYYHCKANNLREVWAYLWTNWYAPGKWELWARSSYEGAIPRKRTTMLVEALWRHFKRMVLHHYNRPRMDFATYALVTQGIAPYRVRFNKIIRNPRNGRAKLLCGEQIPIKRAWLALRKRPIMGLYDMDVGLWLCSCGAQKYHPYLLCKHLVQALPLPSPDWWANVIRLHTAPFYDIRDLLPENQRESAPKPATLGPRYWTRQDSAGLQHSLPPMASQSLVSGPHAPYIMTELRAGIISSKGP
jgi:hypothetical protein